jgi:hypothetical protein
MKANEYDKKLGEIFRDARAVRIDSLTACFCPECVTNKFSWTVGRLMAIENADRAITGHEMVLLCRLYGLDIKETIEAVWGKG